MKSCLFFFFVLLVGFFAIQSANATVWTVSNNANRPAQFTTIQAAVDSAVAGDTILITGSNSTYTNYSEYVDIFKPLTLIGEAIGTPGVSSLRVSVINVNLKRLNSSLSASGTRIFGLNIDYLNFDPSFSGASAGQQTLNNVLIERCYLAVWFNSSNNYGYSNNTIRNSVIVNYSSNGMYIPSATYSSNLITNCVFNGARIDGSSNNVNAGWVIRNNVFINRTSASFGSISGLIIENNIFYASEPTGATSSTFNNNLTYLCNSNTIPYGNNVGSGNIINANPTFVNYPQLGGAHSWGHNYGLQTGSPAIGTGTNGTNIGLTGGNAPVNNIPQHPKIPVVTEVNIPVSSVPVGGTLQINIKANTRD